jgi:signal transduction histidine kinase
LRSRGLAGAGPSTAAEASLHADLIGHIQAAQAGAARDATLDGLFRIFAARLAETGAQDEADRCRARAVRLVSAGGDLSTGVALTYASDLFALCTIERPWSEGEVETIAKRLASFLNLSRDAVRLELFLGAVRTPQLLELPTALTLDTQLRLIEELAQVAETSLWAKDSSARLVCLADTGATAKSRRFRAVAEQALEGTMAVSGSRGTILGVPVMQWDTPRAALVARTRVEHREHVSVFLREAATAMSPVIERAVVLERSAARERSLVGASERRLGRLAFDLHDGALQHIAALGTDLFLMQKQLGQIVPDSFSAVALARAADVESQIRELERVLRELAHSLEPGSLVRRPLPDVIGAEAASFTEHTGIAVQQRVTGDFSGMTPSQKIALIRAVQEALTNIREHANATTVRITIRERSDHVHARIEDDGAGFHVARTLLDSAQRGRLGLVGGSERIRLLGGKFDVRSKPGGPTIVSLSLPRWRPLGVERHQDDGVVPAAVSDAEFR